VSGSGEGVREEGESCGEILCVGCFSVPKDNTGDLNGESSCPPGSLCTWEGAGEVPARSLGKLKVEKEKSEGDIPRCDSVPVRISGVIQCLFACLFLSVCHVVCALLINV
jgi:hypothetical protein